jgi:hypothetical protein
VEAQGFGLRAWVNPFARGSWLRFQRLGLGTISCDVCIKWINVVAIAFEQRMAMAPAQLAPPP